MADAAPPESDCPSSWTHPSLTAFRNFVSKHPQLVEVRGLRKNDGRLLTGELLQLFFESDRFSGGGQIEKMYVSEENSSALLTFKNAQVAKMLIDAHYMAFDKCLLTVSLPTAHMWNVEASAILVKEFRVLQNIEPGVCLQELKRDVKAWFAGIKYRTDESPHVLDVVFFVEKRQALILFEDFIDALHIMQMAGNEGMIVNGIVAGHLQGPMEIPDEIKRQLAMTASRRESLQSDDSPVRPRADCITVRIKKDKLQKGITVERLEGIIRELGFNIQVFDKRDGKVFILEGQQLQVKQLLETVKRPAPQQMLQQQTPQQTPQQMSQQMSQQTSQQTSQGSARNEDCSSQSGDGEPTSSAAQPKVIKMSQSVEETQPPHPVNPTDYLAEHRLAEQKERERQAIAGRGGSHVEKVLPNGTTVLIYTENITKIMVDVIVNAANGGMNHAGGVAKAIADAAGYALEQEGFMKVKDYGGDVPVTHNIVTTGGKLCHNVIHAVGPAVREFGVESCKHLVYVTVINTLETFAGLQALQSIAIPAISSGVYGVPIDIVASAMKEAVMVYDASIARPSAPKKIHLVNILPETTCAIIKAFQEEPGSQTRSVNEAFDQMEQSQVQHPGQDGEKLAVFPARMRRGPSAAVAQKSEQEEKLEVFPARHRRGQGAEVAQQNEERNDDGTSQGGQAERSLDGGQRSALGSSQGRLLDDETGGNGEVNKQDRASNLGQIFQSSRSFYDKIMSEGDVNRSGGDDSGVANGGLFDQISQSRATVLQGKQSPPYSSQTRNVHSTESLEKTDMERKPPASHSQQLPVDSVRSRSRGRVVEGQRDTAASNSVASANQTSVSSERMMQSTQPSQAHINEDTEFLKLLAQESSRLKKYCFEIWEEKPSNTCSDTELQHRKDALLLFKDIHTLIEKRNAKEARLCIENLQRLARESLEDTTKNTDSTSTARGDVRDDMRMWLAGNGRSEKEAPNDGQQNSGNKGLAKSGQDEAMDVDDNMASLSKSSSGSSSYEVIPEPKEGDLDEMDKYVSEDEDEQGATGMQVDAKVTNETKSLDECSICLEVIVETKKLEQCGHTFCRMCIDKSFESCGPKCPLCGTMYGKMQGTQPRNGTMQVQTLQTALPGYPGCGTIIIYYSFPDGIQEAHHPNPGKRYTGTRRTAFLPNNVNGKKVMKLLCQAFEARLVFTIGQSVTTGRSDTVVWNNIHHKTSQTGGPQGFGYPDPTYLTRVFDELAAFGIK